MKLFVLFLIFFSANCYGARIISTAPALSEMVALLGYESSLVGVTPYCQDGKSAAKIGTALELNYEKVIALKPDIVLLQENTKGKVSADLKRLGIKFLSLRIVTLADLFSSWREVAKALGSEEKIIDQYEELVKLKKSKQRVLFVLGGIVKRSVMVAGTNTFYHDLVTKMGLTNAVEGSGWPSYDSEMLRHLSATPLTVYHFATHENRLWSKEQWSEFCPKCQVVFSSNVRATYPGPSMIKLVSELLDLK